MVPKSLKIVEIIRSAQYGGVEHHVCELIRHLLKAGHEPILIALSNVIPSKQFQDLGVPIIILNDNIKFSLKSCNIIWPLHKELKKFQPNLVHLHGPRPLFFGAIAARLARVTNIVSTIHGSYKLMAYRADGTVNRYLLLLSKFIHLIGFFLSDKIITVSKKLNDDINEIVSYVPLFLTRNILGKIITIHSGIEIKQFHSDGGFDLRRDLNIPAENFVVGFIGRLDEPTKGIAVLLNAATKLISKGFKVSILIVGDGHSKNHLINLAETYRIEKNVSFVGYREDVPRILNAFDIFVLPSLSEGLPLVIIEAMAAGRPVVASNVGGIPEVVVNGQTGILIPPNNPDALVSAIEYLKTNPVEAAEMGRRGRGRAEELFSVDKSYRKILELYSEVSATGSEVPINANLG